MANKKERPQALTSAEKATLSKILKKARAFKAFYADNPAPSPAPPRANKKERPRRRSRRGSAASKLGI